MSKIIFLLLITISCAGVLSGCSGEKTPTFAGKEQAEHQKPKTGKAVIDQYLVLLKLDDNLRKNLRGADRLGKSGAEAAFALPELEELAESHPEPEVQEAIKQAIELIKSAGSAEE